MVLEDRGGPPEKNKKLFHKLLSERLCLTLIYELDLDMLKIHLNTKNEIRSLRRSKVIARTTDTQLKARDGKHYLPAFAEGNK